MKLLYVLYWIRYKCSYRYYGFGFSELINIPGYFFAVWILGHKHIFFWKQLDALVFLGAFSSLHASRCVVLFPSEMKQLKLWYFAFCKLLNTQDQVLEVIPVPCTGLSCILVAIVLNIRVFFSSAFWKVIFWGRTIPMLFKIFHTFRFNLCGSDCVYISDCEFCKYLTLLVTIQVYMKLKTMLTEIL